MKGRISVDKIPNQKGNVIFPLLCLLKTYCYVIYIIKLEQMSTKFVLNVLQYVQVYQLMYAIKN